MSLKVVKSKSQQWRWCSKKQAQFVRCKMTTTKLAPYRKSERQLGPDSAISSASRGTFRTVGVRQKCPVTTIIEPQSD